MRGLALSHLGHKTQKLKALSKMKVDGKCPPTHPVLQRAQLLLRAVPSCRKHRASMQPSGSSTTMLNRDWRARNGLFISVISFLDGGPR